MSARSRLTATRGSDAHTRRISHATAEIGRTSACEGTVRFSKLGILEVEPHLPARLPVATQA